VLQNHTVYILLWNKEALQHIEVHVTRNGSLDGKKMLRKPVFSLQHRKHSPSNCLADVRQLGADSVIPQMIRLRQFTFPDKYKVVWPLKTILSKNNLRRLSISIQKSLQYGRSLGFNSCSSLNLYGRNRQSLT
jgi:hypothetical protein